MTVNEYFEKVYCLNLDRRPDRWEEATKLFKEHDIDVERVSAIDGSLTNINWPLPLRAGAVGCSLSQLFVLKHAKQLGLDNYLFFEDDVTFVDGFTHQFAKYIPEVPSDWDMIYLSGNIHLGPVCPQISEHVYKCQLTLAAHSVAIRHTVYDHFINALTNITQPCDVHYARAHSNINAYIIVPYLTGQRPGFSDIVGQVVNYGFELTPRTTN